MENRNLDSYHGTSGSIVFLTPDFDGPAANWFVQNTDSTFSNYIDFGWQTRTVRLYGGMSMSLEIEAGEISVEGSGAEYIVTAMGSDSNPVTLKKESGSSGGGSGTQISGVDWPTAGTASSRNSFSVVQVVVSKTSGSFSSTRYFELPASPEFWIAYRLKDGQGDGATNNLNVVASPGHTIDGSTAPAIISSNYGSLSFVFDGVDNWSII
jgi:hypothetical protein